MSLMKGTTDQINEAADSNSLQTSKDGPLVIELPDNAWTCLKDGNVRIPWKNQTEFNKFLQDSLFPDPVPTIIELVRSKAMTAEQLQRIKLEVDRLLMQKILVPQDGVIRSPYPIDTTVVEHLTRKPTQEEDDSNTFMDSSQPEDLLFVPEKRSRDMLELSVLIRENTMDSSLAV